MQSIQEQGFSLAILTETPRTNEKFKHKKEQPSMNRGETDHTLPDPNQLATTMTIPKAFIVSLWTLFITWPCSAFLRTVPDISPLEYPYAVSSRSFQEPLITNFRKDTKKDIEKYKS
jgi:hypothetical protein